MISRTSKLSLLLALAIGVLFLSFLLELSVLFRAQRLGGSMSFARIRTAGYSGLLATGRHLFFGHVVGKSVDFFILVVRHDWSPGPRSLRLQMLDIVEAEWVL